MIVHMPEIDPAVMVRDFPPEETVSPEWEPTCLLDARQPIECKIPRMAQSAAES